MKPTHTEICDRRVNEVLDKLMDISQKKLKFEDKMFIATALLNYKSVVYQHELDLDEKDIFDDFDSDIEHSAALEEYQSKKAIVESDHDKVQKVYDRLRSGGPAMTREELNFCLWYEKGKGDTL